MTGAVSKTPFAIPVRHDLDFRFDHTPAVHFAENACTSHLWNALSIIAPRTEGFLIRAMKKARADVTDPALRSQVDAFLMQEALHSRHHSTLNTRLAALGYDVERASRIAEEGLRALADASSVRGALSFVIVGEYAIYAVAKAVLENPAMLAGTTPEVRRLMEWHCIEEMEHQSVACEVYEHLFGLGAKDRIAHARALFKACRVLAGILSKMQGVLMENEPSIPFSARLDHLRYLYVSPGLLRRIVMRLPLFFAPGFRHWDDAADIRLIEQGLERISASAVVREATGKRRDPAPAGESQLSTTSRNSSIARAVSPPTGSGIFL